MTSQLSYMYINTRIADKRLTNMKIVKDFPQGLVLGIIHTIWVTNRFNLDPYKIKDLNVFY